MIANKKGREKKPDQLKKSKETKKIGEGFRLLPVPPKRPSDGDEETTDSASNLKAGVFENPKKRPRIEPAADSELATQQLTPIHDKSQDAKTLGLPKSVQSPSRKKPSPQVSQESNMSLYTPWFIKTSESVDVLDNNLVQYMQTKMSQVKTDEMLKIITTTCKQETRMPAVACGVFAIIVADYLREALMNDIIKLANSLNSISTCYSGMVREICLVSIRRDLAGFITSISDPSTTLELELLTKLNCYITFINERDFLTLLGHLSRSITCYKSGGSEKKCRKMLNKILQKMAHVNIDVRKICLPDKDLQTTIRESLISMSLPSVLRSSAAADETASDLNNHFLEAYSKYISTQSDEQTTPSNRQRPDFFLTCIKQLCDPQYASVPVSHLLVHNIQKFDIDLDLSITINGNASLKLSTSIWKNRFGSEISSNLATKFKNINNGKIPQDTLDTFQTLVFNECSFMWDGKTNFQNSFEKTKLLIQMSQAVGISDYLYFLAQGRDYTEIIGNNWAAIWIVCKDNLAYGSVVQNIYRNAEIYFGKSDDMFKYLSLEHLRFLLDRDELVLRESYVLAAVLKWTKEKASEDNSDMFLWNELKMYIRFIDIDEDYLTTLKQSQHLSDDEIKIIHEIYRLDRFRFPKNYHYGRNFKDGNKWGKRRVSAS